LAPGLFYSFIPEKMYIYPKYLTDFLVHDEWYIGLMKHLSGCCEYLYNGTLNAYTKK